MGPEQGLRQRGAGGCEVTREGSDGCGGMGGSTVSLSALQVATEHAIYTAVNALYTHCVRNTYT